MGNESFQAMAVKMQGLNPVEAHFSRDQFFFRQNAQCFFGTFTVSNQSKSIDRRASGYLPIGYE